MKKTIVLLALICNVPAFGQESNSISLSEKKHEIKLGAIKLLAGPIFEGTYEYIYSKDFTFGSSVLIDLQKKMFGTKIFQSHPLPVFIFKKLKNMALKDFLQKDF